LIGLKINFIDVFICSGCQKSSFTKIITLTLQANTTYHLFLQQTTIRKGRWELVTEVRVDVIGALPTVGNKKLSTSENTRIELISSVGRAI